MNTHLLAWAAGFFDGEGCTSIGTNRPTPNIYLVQTSKDGDAPETLIKFHQAIGVGKVSGPFKYGKQHYSPRWEYRAHGIDAVEVLLLMWPWLGKVKRNQAGKVFSKTRDLTFSHGQGIVRGTIRWDSVPRYPSGRKKYSGRNKE